MLLQSHANEVALLPALPSAWPAGHIHGICARGGFVMDIDWENGKLKGVKVFSKLGKELTLRYQDRIVKLKTQKDTDYIFNGNLNELKL